MKVPSVQVTIKSANLSLGTVVYFIYQFTNTKTHKQTNKQTNKHIELEQVQVMRSNAIFAMRDEKDLIDTI